MMLTIFENYRRAMLRHLDSRERAKRAGRSRQNDEGVIMSETNSVELTKVEKDDDVVDGFDGYEDRVEGDEQQHAGSVIQGRLLKFTNEAASVTGDDGEELPAGLELVAIDVNRIVQKWHEQRPVETIILEPSQKFLDVKNLNDEAPKSEWIDGPDGKPRGPWQAQYLVYILNPATMDRFTFATGTVGGGIAVRELVDKTKWMRRLRGDHVYPIVTLADVFMNTRFGGRQRPRFMVKRWIALGAAGKALAAPADPMADKVIATPALAEEMDDKLPF
jgi:hypothetical protein